MQAVRVDVNELIAALQTNREAHRGTFEKAMAGYRKAVISWLETQLDLAAAGKDFETAYRKPIPQDHTTDYDVALQMLEMSTDKTVTIRHEEFLRFVRDEWGWQREFTQTSSMYLAEG